MKNLLLSHLVDVSLRTLPLALAAVAVLRIPKLRSAAWAHAVWSMVLLSMLVLFAAGPLLKPMPLRVLPAPAAVQAPRPVVFEVLAPRALMMPTPQAAVPVAVPMPAPRRRSAGEIATWLYAAVAAALFARLLVGSWLAHRLLAGSVRAGEDFYESPRVAVPLTIGWLRPVILLPASWRSWEELKLEAVLLHERAHLRRRDSAVALLAGINRCVFWFHPLAWWMERKLAFLAEQACDEACVSALENRGAHARGAYVRGAYAKVLLEMAAAVEASGGRLSGHALAMARPSQVRRRIDAILDETRTAHRGLTAIAWLAVLLCAVPMIYAAGSMRVEPRIGPKLSLPRLEPKLPLPRPVVSGAPLLTLPPSSLLALPEPYLIAQAAAPALPPPPAEPAAPRQQIIYRSQVHKFAELLAQATPPGPPPPQAAASASPIFFPVSVLDPAGRSVTGLEASNFKITGGAREHPIVAFDAAEGKHSVAVMNTTGISVPDVLGSTLDPRDESFVVAVAGAAPANADAFMDALADAVQAAKVKQNPVKVLVVLMQGGRVNAMAKEASVSRVIRLACAAPRVAIFFVDIGDMKDVAEWLTVPVTQAGMITVYAPLTQQDDLNILAQATGGQIIPVARREEMPAALQRLGEQLRHQYLLGVAPTQGPAAYERLRFEIIGPRGVPPLRAIGPVFVDLRQ